MGLLLKLVLVPPVQPLMVRIERALQVQRRRVLLPHRLDLVTAARQEILPQDLLLRMLDVADPNTAIQTEPVIAPPQVTDHRVVPPDRLVSVQRNVVLEREEHPLPPHPVLPHLLHVLLPEVRAVLPAQVLQVGLGRVVLDPHVLVVQVVPLLAHQREQGAEAGVSHVEAPPGLGELVVDRYAGGDRHVQLVTQLADHADPDDPAGVTVDGDQLRHPGRQLLVGDGVLRDRLHQLAALRPLHGDDPQPLGDVGDERLELLLA